MALRISYQKWRVGGSSQIVSPNWESSILAGPPFLYSFVINIFNIEVLDFLFPSHLSTVTSKIGDQTTIL